MMESELRKKFDVLLKLQKIEMETAEIEAGLKRLPDELAALDEKNREKEKVLSDASVQLNTLQQAYRTLELEAKSVQSQIAKSEDKLGSVKTNKEYQSSLKEIDDLAASLSAIEDRMIDCLEKIDELESTVKEKKDELQRTARALEKEKTEVLQAADVMRQQIATLVEERGQVVSDIDNALMNTYNNVKENIGNFAIAVVKDAVCLGCHVNLPPQMFNELLRFDKIFYCPHCERLIYPQSE